MSEMKYVFGPVPSRRLGISLGISPIPKKTCNYSCVYCQLGRTNPLTNKRTMFFPIDDIISEFEQIQKSKIKYDVITIVGEGEPTLYLGLGELIYAIKERTQIPIAVITNGALLYDVEVRNALYSADIVLPTIDAYNQNTLKEINRPHGSIDFDKVKEGMIEFSKNYKGQLWIETMLIDGMNDSLDFLNKYKKFLKNFKYERLYINTPVRPPAEEFVRPIDSEKMKKAVDILEGISIDLLESEGFHSEIKDHYKAILSIIKRHPMNQFEIEEFLKLRGCENIDELLCRLGKDDNIIVLSYKGYNTYRIK
ncbi:radical SAM protein [Anaerovorax odorimutans]|uniref:radical SAM protein n=1 Tax=Anaerovorax odorimutans TaxID=109327 RepID=UPI000423E62A|nr:radical SAM protein [Anaerovorax odorimutans]